ncbi:hypothetical protein AOLI_G00127280 [Acnodon oligacanthus]
MTMLAGLCCSDVELAAFLLSLHSQWWGWALQVQQGPGYGGEDVLQPAEEHTELLVPLIRLTTMRLIQLCPEHLHTRPLTPAYFSFLSSRMDRAQPRTESLRESR